MFVLLIFHSVICISFYSFSYLKTFFLSLIPSFYSCKFLFQLFHYCRVGKRTMDKEEEQHQMLEIKSQSQSQSTNPHEDDTEHRGCCKWRCCCGCCGCCCLIILIFIGIIVVLAFIAALVTYYLPGHRCK